MSDQPLIGVVMGSDSDWSVMSDAVQVLKEFGIDSEVEVLSAHRTPERMIEWGKAAAGRGLKVIIAGAGGAAHLPGMLASVTTLPVIGVPVATVSINGAKNAGILAARMLGAFDAKLAEKLSAYTESLKEQVAEKNAKLKSQL